MVILLKTENWKHCSKIIFKYVNNVVGSIFNENFVEKRDLWVPWTVHGSYWNSVNALLKKKKKKGETLDVDVDAVSKWILSMRLDLDENYKLFYYSVYFCYYS